MNTEWQHGRLLLFWLLLLGLITSPVWYSNVLKFICCFSPYLAVERWYIYQFRSVVCMNMYGWVLLNSYVINHWLSGRWTFVLYSVGLPVCLSVTLFWLTVLPRSLCFASSCLYHMYKHYFGLPEMFVASDQKYISALMHFWSDQLTIFMFIS